jgi:hypothetical protein
VVFLFYTACKQRWHDFFIVSQQVATCGLTATVSLDLPGDEYNPGSNNNIPSLTVKKALTNPFPYLMKHADRPFLLIIIIAVSLLYTVMAWIS